MKNLIHSVICVLFAILIFGFVQTAFAQDATKVDSAHYKVEFENDQVRVLRITYAPGEKSVMHEHPDGVAVFLNDQSTKFTFPDGKTQEVTGKAGQTIWMAAVKHLPENPTDKSFELIFIEMKVKPAMTKKN